MIIKGEGDDDDNGGNDGGGDINNNFDKDDGALESKNTF